MTIETKDIKKKICPHYEYYIAREPVYDMDTCKVDHFVEEEHGFCNIRHGDSSCLCGGFKVFCDLHLEELREKLREANEQEN